MRASQRSCALFIAAICTAHLVRGLALPVPPSAQDAWDKVLDQIWLRAKPRISFCLGESESGVYNTVLQSFPRPLPTGPEDDSTCNNVAEVGRHLCGPKSIMEYYKVCFALANPSASPSDKVTSLGTLKPCSCHSIYYSQTMMKRCQTPRLARLVCRILNVHQVMLSSFLQ